MAATERRLNGPILSLYLAAAACFWWGMWLHSPTAWGERRWRFGSTVAVARHALSADTQFKHTNTKTKMKYENKFPSKINSHRLPYRSKTNNRTYL